MLPCFIRFCRRPNGIQIDIPGHDPLSIPKEMLEYSNPKIIKSLMIKFLGTSIPRMLSILGFFIALQMFQRDGLPETLIATDANILSSIYVVLRATTFFFTNKVADAKNNNDLTPDAKQKKLEEIFSQVTLASVGVGITGAIIGMSYTGLLARSPDSLWLPLKFALANIGATFFTTSIGPSIALGLQGRSSGIMAIGGIFMAGAYAGARALGYTNINSLAFINNIQCVGVACAILLMLRQSKWKLSPTRTLKATFFRETRAECKATIKQGSQTVITTGAEVAATFGAVYSFPADKKANLGAWQNVQIFPLLMMIANILSQNGLTAEILKIPKEIKSNPQLLKIVLIRMWKQSAWMSLLPSLLLAIITFIFKNLLPTLLVADKPENTAIINIVKTILLMAISCALPNATQVPGRAFVYSLRNSKEPGAIKLNKLSTLLHTIAPAVYLGLAVTSILTTDNPAWWLLLIKSGVDLFTGLIDHVFIRYAVDFYVAQAEKKLAETENPRIIELAEPTTLATPAEELNQPRPLPQAAPTGYYAFFKNKAGDALRYAGSTVASVASTVVGPCSRRYSRQVDT